MNFNMQRVTQSFGRTQALAQRNSPHIFFAAGIAGMITSAVLACRATLKLEKELDAMKLDLDSTRADATDLLKTQENYGRRDYAQDLGGVYARNSLTIVKLYAPSIIIGSASIACLAGSHAQLTRRNAALSSTLALVTQSFNEYRERIKAEVGEERELQLYHCMDDNELTVGTGVALEKANNPDAPIGYKTSPWATQFDQKSKLWKPSAIANEEFLRTMQKQANLRLQAFGIVFLNEIHEMIGLPRTQAGQIYGWVWQSDDPMADSYIDFGIYKDVSSAKIPYNRSIWLDFNVDGPVHHVLGLH